MSDIDQAAVATGEAEEQVAAAGPAAAMSAPAEEPISEALLASMDAARSAEKQGVDKGIDAWRKLVQQNPGVREPRGELARLYRTAERWNALVEVLKEQAEKLPNYSVDEKVATLFELVGIYRDRLKLDVMVINTYNAILALSPRNQRALDALATQYETMKRWPDLIGVLQKKAAQGSPEEQVALYGRVAQLYQE